MTFEALGDPSSHFRVRGSPTQKGRHLPPCPPPVHMAGKAPPLVCYEQGPLEPVAKGLSRAAAVRGKVRETALAWAGYEWKEGFLEEEEAPSASES